MTRTFKDTPDSFLAPHARESYRRARQDRDYARHVGFYDPEQEVQEPVDITTAFAKRVLDGRE
jgi:hypothetical protein